MANSSYLKQVVEPYVVAWVSKQIGQALVQAKLTVGHRQDGTPVQFEFDGVSDDGGTGVLVSTSYSLKSGVIHKLHADASTLLQGPFSRRLMAFVSKEAMENFVNKIDGLVPLSQIEMLLCDDLPSEVRKRIEAFQAEAKAEVADKGNVLKVARKRR